MARKVYGFTISCGASITVKVCGMDLGHGAEGLVTARVATKSMLASKNVRPSVTLPEQGLHWLNVLAGELNVRLRDAREISPGLWPKILVLSHRTGMHPASSGEMG